MKVSERKHVNGFTLSEVLVSIAISGLLISSTVSGYNLVARRAEWSGLSVAANQWVIQRMEQVRAARWDMTRYPIIDELVETNYPCLIQPLNTLAKGTNSGVWGTNSTSIRILSDTPPLKLIKVECVWSFNSGKLFTNQLVMYRSSDP